MPHIVIDARFYGPVGKGLGRYTQKLVEYLEKKSHDHESNTRYSILLREENFNDYHPSHPAFSKVLADFQWYSLQEQLLLLRLLRKLNPDLVHFPHFNVPLFYKKPFIVTIHDLILKHFPTRKASTLGPMLYLLKYSAYKIVIRNAIHNSQKIITTSQFTKNDILNHYNVPPNKLTITYQASDQHAPPETRNTQQDVIKKHGIMKPYLLYVGNAYPHKNLDRLIKVFVDDQTLQKKCRLVLVGKIDYFYERLIQSVPKKLKKEKTIVFIDGATESELATLYQNAYYYIMPSLYEGFGLTPVEAQSHDTPVLASDHSCTREILQKGALYFDGENSQDMKRAINQVLTDTSLRSVLKKNGRKNAKRFSWEDLATKTQKIYETTHT